MMIMAIAQTAAVCIGLGSTQQVAFNNAVKRTSANAATVLTTGQGSSVKIPCLLDLHLWSRVDPHILGTLICSASYRVSRALANLGSLRNAPTADVSSTSMKKWLVCSHC